MKKSKIGVLAAALPLTLGLSLTLAACGGSSDGDGTSNGGTSNGGTKATNGGTGNSAAGTSSKAGSGGTGNTAGSTGNTAGTSSNPGTDGSTPLGELTDDQFDQLCKDFAEKFSGEELQDANCRFSGVLAAILAQSDAQAQELCKSAYDECKSTPPDVTENCEKPGAECTATVDEMNACMDDLQEFSSTFNDSIPSCDELKVTDIATLFTQLGGGAMLPASCQTYEEKCPDGPMAEPGGDATP